LSVKENILKTACLIIILVIVSGISAIGQHYPVRTYTEADGLASSMIFDIEQDSSGIIWIARRSGISSYDGINFKNYNVNDGLKPISYSFLRLDSKNKLWAVAESGQLVISVFTGKHWKTITCDIRQTSGFYNSYTAFDVFYENNEPVVLVGSDKEGLFKYQNSQWKQFKTSNGLPGTIVNGIIQFDGKELVETNKGLAVFKNNTFDTKIREVSEYLSKNILAVAVDGNCLWILGENWLGSLCDEKFTLYTNDFILPLDRNGRQCFLQCDRMGKVYFGNLFKVLCYDQQSHSLETLTRKNGLISEGGSCALIDREKNTWIGGFRGITKIQSRRFACFYQSDGLFSNEVASGIEYSPGRYVFGHDGELTFYDGRSFSTLLLHPSSINVGNECRVLDITKDSQQNLWAAVTTKGMARIDRNRKVKWYTASQGLDGYVFSVISSSDGKIYAGTSNGFYELVNERFVHRFFNEMHGSSVRKLYPGKDNSLFISTINWGLLEIKNGKVFFYSSSDNPLANNVFSFFLDSKSRKWVGTAAGLFMVRDSMLVRAGPTEPAISRPVYMILEDRKGRLWFGCDNGIYRWDGNVLDHFSIAEGVSGQEINRSAGFIDYKDRIWFGTNNGLTVYDPLLDYLPKQVPPPLLALLFAESGNDSLNLDKNIVFPRSQNNPTFHFKALSFIDEKKVVYRYKLEGLDTAWSQEVFYQNNSVKYNNLKPGTYRFGVKAGNSIGIWTEPVYSNIITVQQPLWFRWWFLLGIIVLLGGISTLLGWFVLVARYNARLERMVSERTRELEHSEQMLKESNQAKDNFFSIIAHDLKSPFNVILGMLDLLTTGYSEYSDEERQTMLIRLKNASTRTIDLLENLLTWAMAQKGMLPFKPVDFDILEIVHENVMLFESAAHSKDILINLKVEKGLLVRADRNMVNTVVRNLISNAIKFTLPGGTISINFVPDYHNQIMVSVKDTGVGMPPETQNNLFKIEKRAVVKGTNNEMGTGLGLILSKDFIEKNDGRIWVESEEGSGSTFHFTLPAA